MAHPVIEAESITLKGFFAHCRYPIFMALDDDQNIYVVMANNNLIDAWVYKFDQQGYALTAFEHPQFPSEVAGLVRVGNRMIVADYARWELLAFRLDGKASETFGSAALTGELQALYQATEFYKRLRTGGEIGLIIACALVLLLYAVLKWKGQQDVPASVWDHRLPPVRLPEKVNPRRTLWYTVAGVVGLGICFAMINFAEHEPIVFASHMMAAAVLCLWFFSIGGHLLSRFTLREQHTIIKKILTQLPIPIPETEAIEAVIMLRKGAWPGFKKLLPRRFIALATSQRLLFIELGLSSIRIQSIWQLPHHQIASVELPAAPRFDIIWLPARMTIVTSGNQNLLFETSRFELLAFATTLEQTRQQPIAGGKRTGPIGLEQIFPTTTTPRSQPVSKRPMRAALLSVLYPGIGQLYNGALWKGILFLVLYTVTLCKALQLFMDWYLQYIEVSLENLLFWTSIVVLVWFLAILEAYHEAPQQLET